MAVADSYDAMTSARPYRHALPAMRRHAASAPTAAPSLPLPRSRAFDTVDAEFRMIHDLTNVKSDV